MQVRLHVKRTLLTVIKMQIQHEVWRGINLTYFDHKNPLTAMAQSETPAHR